MVYQSVLTVSATAHPYHHHHYRHHYAERHVHHHYARYVHHRFHRFARVEVERPEQSPSFLGRITQGVASVVSGGSSLVSTARSYLGSGAVFGRSNLWCARFVNTMLAKTGRQGTGSDAAASFFNYGHSSSNPHVGDIAVRGHHVGIVAGISARGNPIVISGNNGNRVREGEESVRAYRYRSL